MVAQNVRVCGSEGLDLSGGNGREEECSQENYEGKGAHGAQYGADPSDRQGNGSVQAALDGIADAKRVRPLRPSSKAADDPSKLARYLFKDGG